MALAPVGQVCGRNCQGPPRAMAERIVWIFLEWIDLMKANMLCASVGYRRQRARAARETVLLFRRGALKSSSKT